MSEYSATTIDSYAGGASKDGLYSWVKLRNDIYEEDDYSEDSPKRVEIIELVRKDLFDTLTAENNALKCQIEGDHCAMCPEVKRLKYERDATIENALTILKQSAEFKSENTRLKEEIAVNLDRQKDQLDECEDALAEALNMRINLQNENKLLKDELAEARANDMCSFRYLSKMRQSINTDVDFPTLVSMLESATRVKGQVTQMETLLSDQSITELAPLIGKRVTVLVIPQEDV